MDSVRWTGGDSVVPIRPPIDRLGATVLRVLVDRLVSGEVAAHQNLPPENALCEEFGVSRTVVRESIKRLQEKGLVTVAQGRGTVANPSSSWNLLDSLVLSRLIAHDETLGILDDLSITRASLEATMAAEVAREHDDTGLERIARALQEMRSLVDDELGFLEADVRFHYAIMDTSRNRIASNVARVLFRSARESQRYLGEGPSNAVELTLLEHEAVFAAIQETDHEAASRAMQTHILGSWARRRLPTSARPLWIPSD